MKRKLLAAASAAIIFAMHATAVSAEYDYGYGYNYDYGYSDNTYGDTYTDDTDITYDYQTMYNDSAAAADNNLYGEDTSSADPTENQPVSVTLTPGKIQDKKFTVQLKIDAKKLITAADITITYDKSVLKVNSNTINEAAGGTAAGSVMEDGIFQYVYANPLGSEFKEHYLTLDMEVVDPTVRSSVLYITVNSMLDEENHEMTCVADGAIIQIEGAVPVDAGSDESMFTELRVAKSYNAISYESMGLKNVKSVTLEDGELATADDKGITTLADGITNMTVAYEDGTFEYFRLVISSPKVDADSFDEAAPVAAAPTNIVKTETRNNLKIKQLLIFVIAVIGIIMLMLEFLFIVVRPGRAFAAVRAAKPKKEKKNAFDDDDFFPETNVSYADDDEVAATDEEEAEEGYYDNDGDYVDEYTEDIGSDDVYEEETEQSEMQEDYGDVEDFEDGESGSDSEEDK